MIFSTEDRERLTAPLKKADDVFACRIRSMASFCMGKPETIFYTDGINCALYVENGNAVVWISRIAPRRTSEDICALLSVTARSIRSNRPLLLRRYVQSRGFIFSGNAAPSFAPEVTEDLRACADVWQSVFPAEFSGESGDVRYADCSHAIRHGMSRVFCIKGEAAMLAFCTDAGYVVADQMAVVPWSRGSGYAGKLLSHAAAVLRPEKGFWFESRDEKSDRFYEKYRFRRAGEWYAYTRAED